MNGLYIQLFNAFSIAE